MRLVHPHYIIHPGLNLAVLLIYVKEKLLEASEHLQGESPCVQLQQGFEKKKFKAVIRENVLAFTVVWFQKEGILAFLGFFKDVCDPSEEQIPFFFVVSIVDNDVPKNLQLWRIEEMFRTLDNKDLEEVHSF